MQRNFFDPPWEQTNVVLIDAALLRRAEQRIVGCEACNPEDAQFLLDSLLDEITGCDPKTTDYVLAAPAHCPRCRHTIYEKTEVAWTDGDSARPLEPSGSSSTSR